MPILNIIKYPSPILKKRATPVDKVTPEIAKLMDDMAETMYAAPGIGLAAPQVGISKRIIVIDVSAALPEGERRQQLIQMANPEIIKDEGEIEWEEGCLSIPEFTIKTKRKARVVVRGLSKSNKELEITAEGLLAIAFQHEIDHLDGRLLIDNVSSIKREMYLKRSKNTAVL